MTFWTKVRLAGKVIVVLLMAICLGVVSLLLWLIPPLYKWAWAHLIGFAHTWGAR